MRPACLILVILVICASAAEAQSCTDQFLWPEKWRGRFHPAGATGCVAAEVLDENGNPLNPEFKVVPRDPSSVIGLTYPGANGRVLCKALSPGVYAVSFSQNGYGSSEDRAFYPEGPQEVSVAVSSACLQLVGRLSRTGRLLLNGRDAVTGQSFVAHAPPGRDWAIVDPSLKDRFDFGVEFGRSFAFRSSKTVPAGKALEVPSQGELYVKIGTDGFEPTEFRIPALQPGETREFEFALLPMAPGCLEGMIVDDKDRPVAGASVHLRPQSFFEHGQGFAQTGNGGKFKAESVDPGLYRVSADKESEGYVADWADTPEVTISSSSQCEELNLKLTPKAAWIMVHLIDAKNQLPASANVVVTDPETGRRLARYISEKESRPLPVPANTPMTIAVSAPRKKEPPDPVTIPPLPSGQIIQVTLVRP